MIYKEAKNKEQVKMAHVAKYTRNTLGHLCRHFERGTDSKEQPIKYSNWDIDITRSHLNYNLAPQRNSQQEYIKERCAQVHCSKRADVNVMCSWVITAPKTLLENEWELFFKTAYNVLESRYGGSENIVSAYVHMDETTPHMHFAFIPITYDKKKDYQKVSAKEVLTRLDLKTFHGDLDIEMNKVFGRDIGILNEITKKGNKSIAELKKIDAPVRLATIALECEEAQKRIELLKQKENALSAKFTALESISNKRYIDRTGKTNLLGNKITFSKEVAESYIQQANENKKLRKVIQEKDNYTQLLEKQLDNLLADSSYQTNQELKKQNKSLSADLGEMISIINSKDKKINNLTETLADKNKQIEKLNQLLKNQIQEIELLANNISDEKLRELKLDKYIKNDFYYNRDFELEI